MMLLGTLLFTMILIALYTFSQPLAVSVLRPLKNRVIVIDPGHGGIDGGANSPGFLEKEVNLEIAKKVKTCLEKNGAKVILTRDQDESLDQLVETLSRHKKDLVARVNIIKKTKPDLFLSIHVNSNPRKPGTTGPMVFYNRRIPESEHLAETLQNNLNQTAEKTGYKKHTPNQAEFYVLSNAPCPGALVEVGFMTNTQEKVSLQDEAYQNQLAKAIAKAIDQHYATSSQSLIPDKARTLVSAAKGKGFFVYFPLKEEDKIVPVPLPNAYPVSESDNPAGYVATALGALIDGPRDDKKYEPVFNNKPKIIEVAIEEGIASVNLSDDLLSSVQGSHQEVLASKALVETVCQFPGVNGVRLLVNGEKADLLSEDIDISKVMIPENPKLKLAIVIDDVGSNNKGLPKLMSMNRPLTLAILPKHEETRKTAELVHKKGYQVFLHVPMEPEIGKASWLGEGAIVSTMSPNEAAEQLKEDLEDVPYVIGMNNHMGSKITKRKDLMLEILKIAKSRNLIYLDSRTTMDTVAPELARELKMPILERSVFLDDVNSFAHIQKRLHEAVDLVKKKGSAVVIGHVGLYGDTTSNALAETVPWIEEQGIQLVFASELVKK